MARKLVRAVVAAMVGLAAASAQAQGLSRARSTLLSFQGELLLFIPIVAVIALIALAVAWGLSWIQFRTLARWGGGLILVGSATQIVNMLMG